MKKVAVVLAGCGKMDGSEIHESVSCLIHLARHGVAYRCFAPDKLQADVVNHASGKPASESRNLLVEAARITRGEISPLAHLNPAEFDAVVFPGGFGAAKNLCTFASEGADCTVDANVERVFKGFHTQDKPIAMCCIAPVIAARVLGTTSGGPGCTVTIGSDVGTAGAIQSMGATNVNRGVTQAHVDETNRLVTTPAYMLDANPYEVFEGIGQMIDSLVAMSKRAPVGTGRN